MWPCEEQVAEPACDPKKAGIATKMDEWIYELLGEKILSNMFLPAKYTRYTSKLYTWAQSQSDTVQAEVG